MVFFTMKTSAEELLYSMEVYIFVSLLDSSGQSQLKDREREMLFI